MSGTPDRSVFARRLRRLGPALAVVLLVTLSWFEAPDRESAAALDRTLVEATTAYGAARAIDATISVVQTIELSPPFAGGLMIGVGQIVDPLNDLVERYAALMEVAIASLIVQRILVAVVADDLFRIALSLAGLGLAAALLWAPRVAGAARRTFLLMLLLRFSLVGVVGLGALVDHAFLRPQTARDMAALDLATTGVHLFAPQAAPDGAVQGLSTWIDKVRRIAGDFDAAALMDRLETAVERLLHVMAVFVLRTLMLPLLFFGLLLRAAGVLWAWDPTVGETSRRG